MAPAAVTPMSHVAADSPASTALPSFDTLVARAGPAVVNVIAGSAVDDGRSLAGSGLPEDPALDFLRRVLPLPPEDEPRLQKLGSGFVISPDGYILTSAHVVANSDEVIVRLPDTSRELPAEVIGIDRRTDGALLKVDGRDLPVVKLGTSKKLHAGDWVAAIGSPFGFNNTVTAGIVGATRRTLPDESCVPFIQTDVAVNPGNSGGPLLNLDGEVVGVNSVIYSRTGGYMGMSFAVPIEVALEVSQQLREDGHVTRGRIGVQFQPLTDRLASSFKAPTTYRKHTGRAEGSSELRRGDVIVAVNQTPLSSRRQLEELRSRQEAGKLVALRVYRGLAAVYIPIRISGPAVVTSQARSS